MPTPAVNRRRIVMVLGAAPFALRGPQLANVHAAGLPAATCVLTPAMTDGPFFIDERLNRSDLAAGTARASVVGGLPLLLNIDLAGAAPTGCLPVAGAQVDVWHADASGEYSDADGAGPNGTKGQSFLRGYQVSDPNGRVVFRTIYPGWYPGRAIHIHVKVREFNAAGNATLDFSTQLFFDDAASDAVMALAPYNTRGPRNVRNARDFLYGSRAGALVKLSAPANGSRGQVATVALGLQRPASVDRARST